MLQFLPILASLMCIEDICLFGHPKKCFGFRFVFCFSCLTQYILSLHSATEIIRKQLSTCVNAFFLLAISFRQYYIYFSIDIWGFMSLIPLWIDWRINPCNIFLFHDFVIYSYFRPDVSVIFLVLHELQIIQSDKPT